MACICSGNLVWKTAGCLKHDSKAGVYRFQGKFCSKAQEGGPTFGDAQPLDGFGSSKLGQDQGLLRGLQILNLHEHGL
eukprot:s4444_g4.t1